MQELSKVAPAFVEMAHQIVWSSVATVDAKGRPRSRILHPYWIWDGKRLEGRVGSFNSPLRQAHLEQNPYVSCNYWTPSQDTCVAECRAELAFDEETRTEVWNTFKSTPPPLGYDPGGIGIPGWETPMSPSFVVLRLHPWRLRVMPGSTMTNGIGEVLIWQA